MFVGKSDWDDSPGKNVTLLVLIPSVNLLKGAGCCELFLVIAGKAIRSSHGSGNPVKAFNMTCQHHNCESEFDEIIHSIRHTTV